MAKRRHWSRALGWTLGAVAASPALAVAMTPTVSRAILRRAIPRLSELIGVRVKAEDAWLQLFPHAAAHARDLVVSGADGRPLLQLESFSASLALWRALFSGLGDIHVHDVEVKRPTVTLSREGLTGLKLKPDALKKRERLAAVFVDRVSVTGGTVGIAALGDAVVRELSVDVKDALLGQPVQLSFQAAVLEDEVNASGTLSVSLPGRGVWGKVSLNDASLDALSPLLPGGLDERTVSGTLNWDGELTTRTDGAYEATGDVSLESVRFRGLGPMQGQGHVRAVATGVSELAAEVTGLELHGVRGDLKGTVSASTSPLQSRVDLRAPRLDAGSFLAYLQPRAKNLRRFAPALREKAQSATVDVHLAVDELAFGRTSARAVDIRGRLHDGVMTGERVTLTAFGGRVDASGSSLDLSQDVPAFELQARAASVDAAEATSTMLGAPILEGQLSGALQLRGRGTSYSSVRRTLIGNGTFGVDDWKLNLAEGKRVAPVRKLLARKPLLRKERAFAGKFSVADGGVRVSQPIGFTLPIPERMPR